MISCSKGFNAVWYILILKGFSLHKVTSKARGKKKKKKSPGAKGKRKDRGRERGSEESVERGGRKEKGPEGAEEQLLSVAPQRTSVHATCFSLWLRSQRGSCLEDKTNAHTHTHLCFW